MFMCVLCTVIGCGDVTAPEGAWVQRDGDVTTLGCHSGKHTWMLRCENNLWEGAVGSCGTDRQSMSITTDAYMYMYTCRIVVGAFCKQIRVSYHIVLNSYILLEYVCFFTN